MATQQQENMDNVVHLRIPPKMLQQIDKQAKIERRSQRVEMIRVLIERGLAANKEAVTA
jgi:metal-responsive CopG/Arc/MetJ family transcriptional regulator